MRACIDWPSGEGAVISNVIAFLIREGVDATDWAQALYALSEGKTFTDPKGRWSLTPMPPSR